MTQDKKGRRPGESQSVCRPDHVYAFDQISHFLKKPCSSTFKMPRFIAGDSLGNIKSLAYSASGKNTELTVLSEGPKTSEEKPNAIQALAVDYKPESTVVYTLFTSRKSARISSHLLKKRWPLRMGMALLLHTP